MNNIAVKKKERGQSTYRHVAFQNILLKILKRKFVKQEVIYDHVLPYFLKICARGKARKICNMLRFLLW